MKPLYYVVTTIMACTAFALGLHADGYIRDFAFFYAGCLSTIVGMFLYADAQ